jgi:hypothetical protein
LEFCLAGGAARYSETGAFENVRKYAFAIVPLKAFDGFSDEFESHTVLDVLIEQTTAFPRLRVSSLVILTY